MSNYYNLSAAQLEEIRKKAGRFNEPWTKEEKQAVIAQFQDGKSVEQIALMQGRTHKAIRIKLIQAGEIAPHLSRKGEPWTEEEVERLGRFHSQGYPMEGCANYLGRLRREVKEKLIEIGLLETPKVDTSRRADNQHAYEPWTEDETRQLVSELANYRSALVAIQDIAVKHGRSLGSIVARAVKMGLCDDIDEALDAQVASQKD